jgi:hypothetical protein
MGSRARHSSGRKAASRRPRKSKRPTTRRKASERPDFDAMLGRFSGAMSIITTAANAMEEAQSIEGKVNANDVSNEIITLKLGLGVLRAVYDEFDTNIKALSS